MKWFSRVFFLLFVLFHSHSYLTVESEQPAAPSLVITYPTSQDTPNSYFRATGTVDPAESGLYALVALVEDQTIYWLGDFIKNGPNWIAVFEGLPTEVDLILYVFSSDGMLVAFQSVTFQCMD